jgi:hypothetical protein
MSGSDGEITIRLTCRCSEQERWVDAILDWRWNWPITRRCVPSLFLVSGLNRDSRLRGRRGDATTF